MPDQAGESNLEQWWISSCRKEPTMEWGKSPPLATVPLAKKKKKKKALVFQGVQVEVNDPSW